jgi:hypothetical protein
MVRHYIMWRLWFNQYDAPASTSSLPAECVFVVNVNIMVLSLRSIARVLAFDRWCLCCRDEELQTMLDIAMSTGIVLDPVYSGKAMHQLLHDFKADPETWQGRKVLFIHTGGLLGMYEKLPQLQPLVSNLGRSQRLDVSSM